MSGFKPFTHGSIVNIYHTHIGDDTQSSAGAGAGAGDGAYDVKEYEGLPALISIFNAKTFKPLIISRDSFGIKKGYERKCHHNRIKDDCKFCKGKNICVHDRIKRRCTLCGVGASVCEHNKQKIQCVTCGGTGICEHGKRRNTCRDCGGVSFCMHGKYPHTCKPCDGKYLCEHKKIRIKCKQCEAVNALNALKESQTHDTS